MKELRHSHNTFKVTLDFVYIITQLSIFTFALCTIIEQF